jgi:hypothetical protein
MYGLLQYSLRLHQAFEIEISTAQSSVERASQTNAMEKTSPARLALIRCPPPLPTNLPPDACLRRRRPPRPRGRHPLRRRRGQGRAVSRHHWEQTASGAVEWWTNVDRWQPCRPHLLTLTPPCLSVSPHQWREGLPDLLLGRQSRSPHSCSSQLVNERSQTRLFGPGG